MSKAARNIRRQRKGTKRLDLTAMKAALKDQRAWACLGVVLEAQDSGNHFDIDDNVISVEVDLQPSQEQITACVAAIGGSFGAGIYAIPPVGAEVYVLIPDGELDFCPVIIGLSSSGTLPSDIGVNTIVIASPPGGEVIIHDGSGSTEALVKKSEFDGHTHGPGSFEAGGDPVAGTSAGASSVTGTTILKAK